MSISLNGDGIVSGVTTFTTPLTGVTTFSSVVVGSGSTSIPSISPSGDNNTGVFFPSADTVALSSGGTERLKVDSDGNINIDFGGVYYDAVNNRLAVGTMSPSAALHVAAANNSQVFIAATDANPTTIIIETDAGASERVRINNKDGALTFDTSNNLERVRIDSSGRLLVGTSTSASAGNAQFALIQLRGNSFSASNNAILAIGRGEAATSITSGEGIGNISFTDNAGNEFAEITCIADANAGSGDYPGRLVFSTTADGASSPTERMRIQQNGYVNIAQRITAGEIGGTYTAGENAFIVSYAGAAANNYTGIIARDTSDNDWVFRGVIGGVTKSEIQADGSFHSALNSYGSTSDARLKENIADAPSQWSDIKNLKVRNYNYTEESGQDTFKQLGVIAQEVETISPGLVLTTTDKDLDGNDLGTSTKSVKYSVLYMKAVKALQEAMERIETLETNNSEMLARITALEAQ